MKRSLLALVLATHLHGAVAYSAHSQGAAFSATAPISITVSGSNPVLVVHSAFTGVTISSVVWSLGSGTSLSIKNIVLTGVGQLESWCVPAPVGGAGTLTVTFSGSVFYSVDVDLFTGADQTTPCPPMDAGSGGGVGVGGMNILVTPSNLGTDDATAGVGGAVASTSLSMTPNSITHQGGAIDIDTGYATGTTGITANFSTNVGSNAALGVRIVAATFVPSVVQPRRH